MKVIDVQIMHITNYVRVRPTEKVAKSINSGKI